MAKNEGKRFEEDFKNSIPLHWFGYRLRDSSGNWNRTGKSSFTPRNMCDFFLFTGSYLFGVECKSFKGKRFPYSNIKDNQLDQLVGMSKSKPVNSQGVFILNSRDTNETYLIFSYLLKELKKTSDKKSLSLDDIRKNGIKIPQKLKKVRYEYDLSVLNF